MRTLRNLRRRWTYKGRRRATSPARSFLALAVAPPWRAF